MDNVTALIFGHNKYASEIIANVEDKYEEVRLFSLEEESTSIKHENYTVEYFDLSDSWHNVQEHIDTKHSIAFCVLEDTAENIFLTISLRAHFKDLTIIAIASDKESANKLKMAGANKVIDLYQVSANRIYNILNKPLATQFIDSILSPDIELSAREITIPKESSLHNTKVDDFNFSKHNVILVGMIDRRLSNQFLFITSGLEHQLNRGDTMVCIGYNSDLDRFEEFILE